MPRYIDADALDKIVYEKMPLKQFGGSLKVMANVREIIASAPTVSPDEVRGVVHCGECKYAERRTPAGIKTEILCQLFSAGMKKDDYCSYGKMMEVSEDA